MAAEPKRKPGRPPLDPTGAQVPQSVRLTPTEIEWLRTHYESVNKGVREAVAELMRKKTRK